MGSSSSRDRYGAFNSYDNPSLNGYPAPDLQLHDYSRWGYIILYLVILLGSFCLNGLFVWTVKSNRALHKTVHYFLACLAVRDLVVTLCVVPFVIDSQAVNLMRWNAGSSLCKVFSFLNISTLATHSFILVFLLLFLYFWYRKQEAYMTEDGQTVVRKNRMHKWAIPLAWILGLGLAIPAGPLADVVFSRVSSTTMCSVWDGRGNSDSGYWVLLSSVLAGFLLPALILVFPFIALTMQLCGARDPRLDPPHSRSAATAIGLFVIFIATRAPSEVYNLMKLFHQSNFGLKATVYHGTPYAMMTFETDIIINALVYAACLLHPLLYFTLNPDYRTGLRVAWSGLYCNADPVQREREAAERRQRKQKQRPFMSRNRLPPSARQNQEQLLQQPQPQIIGSTQPGVQYYPYPKPQQLPQQLPQQQQPLMMPQQQMPQQQFNNQMLQPDQHFLDTSFERISPQLPPVFEFDGLKYIDTARVEPRIGYSPEKTPPKTPETPHYRQKPFATPYAAQQHPPGAVIEMREMSPIQNAPSPNSRPQSFELETLEGSPGAHLRSRRLKEDLDESVEILQESPGSKNRRRTTQESQQSSGYQSTNGTGVSTSRPTSPLDRPASRQSGVEIVITGRTRSRTDLCPDVPRSKFEHSV